LTDYTGDGEKTGQVDINPLKSYRNKMTEAKIPWERLRN
jgi:hypothetical protein